MLHAVMPNNHDQRNKGWLLIGQHRPSSSRRVLFGGINSLEAGLPLP
jgi:hypothetical protein